VLKHAATLLPYEAARGAARSLAFGFTRAALGACWLWLICALGACETGPVRRDDALVVILPREPEQLDPRYVGDVVGLRLTRLIHAGLVRIDSLSLEPVLDLAAAIDIEDDVRYRVRLRPGLRFSDGSTLDADDVVATYRALKDPRLKTRYAASTYKRVRSIEKRGQLEVLFELDAPHAPFITDLEIPVLRAEDAMRPLDAEHLPLGAGAYRLVERTRGSLVLARNPYAAGTEHAPPNLEFVVIHDDNTRALRMLAGAGDLALAAVPPLLVPLFAGRHELSVQTAPGIGTTYVGTNLRSDVLRDVRVRRALAHAIDRESLVRYKLGGRARVARGFVPPGHWAYAADVPTYAFDPARARSLLAEAGFTGEHRLSLVVRTGSDRFIVSEARAMAAMLADVGVDVEVRPSETATLLADLAAGRFELAFLQLPEVFEPHVLSWFFASDRIPQKGVREGGNRWAFRNAEFDQALETGRARLGRADRIAAYHTAQVIMARELPAIPLWHEDVVAISSGRLRDYQVPRDARFATLARGRQP
jgi:peptide/nickel transport system substrate-binding protein